MSDSWGLFMIPVTNFKWKNKYDVARKDWKEGRNICEKSCFICNYMLNLFDFSSYLCVKQMTHSFLNYPATKLCSL